MSQPTTDEIKRVEAYQREMMRKRVVDILEEKASTLEAACFMGEMLDESWTPKSLLGAVKYLLQRQKNRPE